MDVKKGDQFTSKDGEMRYIYEYSSHGYVYLKQFRKVVVEEFYSSIGLLRLYCSDFETVIEEGGILKNDEL